MFHVSVDSSFLPSRYDVVSTQQLPGHCPVKSWRQAPPLHHSQWCELAVSSSVTRHHCGETLCGEVLVFAEWISF